MIKRGGATILAGLPTRLHHIELSIALVSSITLARQAIFPVQLLEFQLTVPRQFEPLRKAG
jgi:hypothetical protein